MSVGTVSYLAGSSRDRSLFLLDTDALLKQDGRSIVDSTGAIVALGLRPPTLYPGRSASVPIEEALRAAEKLDAAGVAAGPWGTIGVVVQDIDEPLKEYLSAVAGALVVDVNPSGPAQKAGLSPGDLVTRSNGTDVSTAAQFMDRIHHAPAGSTMKPLYTRLVDRAVGYLPMPKKAAKLKSERFAVLADTDTAARLVEAAGPRFRRDAGSIEWENVKQV
ncbi:MAG: PDZ domain-containing protein [Acidobacteria bacterium]|nr:PDZ domain-containing protein [Acidobacteriota bacterium]